MVTPQLSTEDRVAVLELELIKERTLRSQLEEALNRQNALNHVFGRALVQIDAFCGALAAVVQGQKPRPIEHAKLKQMTVLNGPSVEFMLAEAAKRPLLADRFGNPLNGGQEHPKLPTDAAAGDVVDGKGPAGS